MSQGSLVIPTTGTLSGLQLVNDVNDALDRLTSLASGSTDPSTLSGGAKPYSMWLDTSVSPNVLRMRNAANTDWAAMGTISSNNFAPDLSNADIATALGYTPVNKAGDTMSGDLTAPNVSATTKVEAPQVKVTTKLVFPDASEQTTAAVTAFPSGTVMLFVQSAAPTGWTKSTAHNDKALRVVSGSVSTGGSVAFTTAFASKSVSGSVGATTLSTSQMPSHGHNITYSINIGGGETTGFGAYFSGYTTGTYTTGSNGSGGSHTHSFTGNAIDMAVEYVDVIIATKN